MAIKKSELYSSLCASCDELRGGMDASQYKDYVLTMLFVKYVSDKYGNKSNSLIEVPKGASFEDMVALKGQTDIGDQINKKILKPLFSANGLEGTVELVDFNDDDNLGSTKEGSDRRIYEDIACPFYKGTGKEENASHLADESGRIYPICNVKGVISC